MSDLREAAQQALEALETASRNGSDGLKRYELKELDDTITALRAALAQPEPFNPDWDRVKALEESLREHMAEIQRLKALAQPEQLIVGGGDLPTLTKWTPMSEYAAKSAAVPGRAEALKQAGYTRRPRQLPKEDEPVAYQWLGTSVIRKRIPKTAEADAWQPLYTAPPQRKPLTEGEIAQIDWKDGETLHDFARAIEKAHGIGGEE